MTKKHLITCSVMFVLVIISTLCICSTKPVPTADILKAKAVPVDVKSTKISLVIPKLILKTTDDEIGYSFANEALPINDAGVNHRMQQSLLKHNYKHVQSNILQNKAGKLFPLIEPILRAYGIPDDFKYLSLVESGFGEGASSKGAKGLWQFMPGTARTYGLKVGHGVDERMSVTKSTVAACKYIRSLYVEFNSWTLAAAAYNNGEIQIERAINRQNEDNYFMMHLNRETASYVYNVIAMKEIILQPAKYGYKNFIGSLKPSDLLAVN